MAKHSVNEMVGTIYCQAEEAGEIDFWEYCFEGLSSVVIRETGHAIGLRLYTQVLFSRFPICL